jgi:alanine-synthesizing transaminase
VATEAGIRAKFLDEEICVLEFATLLDEKADVAVAPSIDFDGYGDQFFRFAIVENEQRIPQATRNISKFFDTSVSEVP